MQRVARGVSEALHRLDLVAVRLDGEHEAGADRLAVQQDGAGAAHPVLTSDVRSGEAQLVAQEVGEEQPRLHRALVAHAIDGDHQRHAQGPQRYALAGSAARRQNSTMKRREALAKLTGRERYVDDLPLDDLLLGIAGRSPAERRHVSAIRCGPEITQTPFDAVVDRATPDQDDGA